MIGITFKHTKDNTYEHLMSLYIKELKGVESLHQFKDGLEALMETAPKESFITKSYKVSWVGDPNKDAYLQVWHRGEPDRLLAEVRNIYIKQ
jgi:hypothetical protein